MLSPLKIKQLLIFYTMANNPCIRCGKERIFVRSWKEKIGNSVVTTIENACPDPECQKIVEADNKKAAKIRSDRLKKHTNPRNRHKK